MVLVTEKLELRGVKNVSTKDNKVYYLLNCENIHTGEPCQFYCKDYSVIPQGLKKGDNVEIKVDYNARFKSLVVKEVKKVG